MTPLVASSDACSHAPHLYAQLGLHKSCLDQLRGLRSAVSVKLAATGATGWGVDMARQQRGAAGAGGVGCWGWRCWVLGMGGCNKLVFQVGVWCSIDLTVMGQLEPGQAIAL